MPILAQQGAYVFSLLSHYVLAYKDKKYEMLSQENGAAMV
jgi:hypothetical protein